ncbi:hypothetical protein M2137_001792 [Parabacteroides sp. PFB2-10]|nr:hypothetical protein [Parabacteroides sp. PFB2-10]
MCLVVNMVLCESVIKIEKNECIGMVMKMCQFAEFQQIVSFW